MLAALTAAPCLARPQATAQQQWARRCSVVVRAQAAPEPAAAAPACPLTCGAAAQGKTSCVHPGRPVANACPDCPRKARMDMMAKTK